MGILQTHTHALMHTQSPSIHTISLSYLHDGDSGGGAGLHLLEIPLFQGIADELYDEGLLVHGAGGYVCVCICVCMYICSIVLVWMS